VISGQVADHCLRTCGRNGAHQLVGAGADDVHLIAIIFRHVQVSLGESKIILLGLPFTLILVTNDNWEPVEVTSPRERKHGRHIMCEFSLSYGV